MTELPRIVGVDDPVIAPAHLFGPRPPARPGPGRDRDR